MLVSTIAAAIDRPSISYAGLRPKLPLSSAEAATIRSATKDHIVVQLGGRSSERFGAPTAVHFLCAGAGISSASSGSSERHRYQLASERYGRQRLACRRIAAGVTGRPRR